jgi:hypothetical protein
LDNYLSQSQQIFHRTTLFIVVMNSPIPVLRHAEGATCSYLDRLMHLQVVEGVEDRRPDVALVHLPFEGAGVQNVAVWREPVHHVPGIAAPMEEQVVLPTG